MKPRLPPLVLLIGSVLLLGLSVWGAPQISRHGMTGARAQQVLTDLHRPRAVFGAVAGFGLALAGVVLQAALRNPLASPYTLGIASGASVGAVAALQLTAAGATAALGASGYAHAVPVGAILGAFVTAALVYALASLRRHAAETLLLTGVAVSLFGAALITMLHYRALAQGSTIDLMAMVRWFLGSLEVVGYRDVGVATGMVLTGTIVLAFVARQLDVATLDDASARGLGVDPVRVRQIAFVGTSIITAGVVAFAGPIGFVGLIVPHAVRAFTGPDPRLLLPCAACCGGAFLVGCDLLARTILYPTNLPINVVTYAIGCPAFLWILVRRSDP